MNSLTFIWTEVFKSSARFLEKRTPEIFTYLIEDTFTIKNKSKKTNGLDFKPN